MLGLEIKIIGKEDKDLIKGLEEVLKELKNGSDNMFLPLNDNTGTECDFSICRLGELKLYDNWEKCTPFWFD